MQPRARLLCAVAMGAIWFASLSPVVSAATGVTRWVWDHVATGGPAACLTAGYYSIQDAVNASSAGDRVYVCPGTYDEQLTLDRSILLEARPLGKAVIRPPASMLSLSDLVTISADSARFRGFRVRIPAGDGEACAEVRSAILVTGSGDVVRNNNIASTGIKTLTGTCGYETGIVVNHPSSRVTFNHVTDFKAVGIMAAASSGKIVRNTVRYLHTNEALCNDGSDQQCFAVGIWASGGYVARNAVYSGPNACMLSIGMCAAGATPAMTGVYIDGNATIADNAVYRDVAGIWSNGYSAGSLIVGNEVTKTGLGILMTANLGVEVAGNLVTRNYLGAQVGSGISSGNNIHDNDFRGNTTWDCSDVSSGTGTAGTANTWANDLGNTENREGLCAGAVVPGA